MSSAERPREAPIARRHPAMTFAFRRRPELLAAGLREHELRRQLRTGELVPVRRGHYLAAPLGAR